MDQPFSTPISTSVQAQKAEPLTIDKLRETLREGEKRISEMDEKLCRSLLLAGFKVMINEALPHGMIAVLPANFKVPLDRAMKGLRPEDLPPGAVMIRNIA